MITPYLESLIFEGKATMKSISMGACQQMVLPVQPNTYVIIYEYYYLPLASQIGLHPIDEGVGIDGTELLQYVNFVSDSNVFHYSHALSYVQTAGGIGEFTLARQNPNADKRSTYIIAKKNLSIYFTKVLNTGLVLSNAVFAPDPPVNTFFGYGNLNIVNAIENYVDNALSGRKLFPLTDSYTFPIYQPAPAAYNQLNVLPGAGGALDLTALGVADGYAAARANHLVLNYVEVNTTIPGDLL